MRTQTKTKGPHFNLDELMNGDIPELKPVMSPWLNKGELAMVWGAGGIGKSWFVHTIALSAATGLKIGENFGFDPQGQHKVMLIDGEMSERQVKKKIRALLKTVPQDDLEMITGLDNLDCLMKTEGHIGVLGKNGEALIGRIEKHEPDLVIIDNAQTMFDIEDPNSAKDVGDYLQMLNRVAKKRDLAVLFVHHANKSKESSPTGSARFTQDTDTVVHLGRPEGNTGELVLDIEFQKVRDHADDWNPYAGNFQYKLEWDTGWQWTVPNEFAEEHKPNQQYEDEAIIEATRDLAMKTKGPVSDRAIALKLGMSPSGFSGRLQRNPELRNGVDEAKIADF